MDEQEKLEQTAEPEETKSTYVIEGLIAGLLIGAALYFTMFESLLQSMGFGAAMGWIIGSRIEKKKKR